MQMKHISQCLPHEGAGEGGGGCARERVEGLGVWCQQFRGPGGLAL